MGNKALKPSSAEHKGKLQYMKGKGAPEQGHVKNGDGEQKQALCFHAADMTKINQLIKRQRLKQGASYEKPSAKRPFRSQPRIDCSAV